MQQNTINKDNTTMGIITHVAEEYIIPMFTATLIFTPIINAFMWLNDNDPSIQQMLYPLATSSNTITYATGQILAVLLIMAGSSLVYAKITQRKRPSRIP